MKRLAPIALFVYNRVSHAERAIASLRTNAEAASSDLFIFSDGAKSDTDEQQVKDVRIFLRTIKGFNTITIIEQAGNLGLANSVVNGVTKLCAEYGHVIVLEDDLVVAPYFLAYMNAALLRYESYSEVMQISGYQFPTEIKSDDDAFFLHFTTTWGWGTWTRAWQYFDKTMAGYDTLRKDRSLRKRFDLDGSYLYFRMLKNKRKGAVDSWGIVWYLSVFLRNGLVLYPKKSFVKNIGFDGTGTHCGVNDAISEIDNNFKVLTYPAVRLNIDSQITVFNYLKNQIRSRNRLTYFLSNLWKV